MEFIWDEKKNLSNFKKHGVWFEEAQTVFDDVDAKEIFDPEHSKSEDRWIIMGFSEQAKLLIVCYAEKADEDLIRIISARKATKNEASSYKKDK